LRKKKRRAPQFTFLLTTGRKIARNCGCDPQRIKRERAVSSLYLSPGGRGGGKLRPGRSYVSPPIPLGERRERDKSRPLAVRLRRKKRGSRSEHTPSRDAREGGKNRSWRFFSLKKKKKKKTGLRGPLFSGERPVERKKGLHAYLLLLALTLNQEEKKGGGGVGYLPAKAGDVVCERFLSRKKKKKKGEEREPHHIKAGAWSSNKKGKRRKRTRPAYGKGTSMLTGGKKRIPHAPLPHLWEKKGKKKEIRLNATDPQRFLPSRRKKGKEKGVLMPSLLHAWERRKEGFWVRGEASPLMSAS